MSKQGKLDLAEQHELHMRRIYELREATLHTVPDPTTTTNLLDLAEAAVLFLYAKEPQTQRLDRLIKAAARL